MRFVGSNPILLHQIKYGKLAEWSKAADLKSVGGAEPSVGSNPTLPAMNSKPFLQNGNYKKQKTKDKKKGKQKND